MNEEKQLESLSKFLSLVLRHKPEILNLSLDKEGFVDLGALLERLRRVKKFSWVRKKDIYRIIELDDRKRFEIRKKDGVEKIRARYGHSSELDVDLEYPEVKLGEIKYLYHGTNAKVLPWILREGLLPMSRKYVHLSPTPEIAYKVGSRRKGKTVILRIDAEAFIREGGRIWKATDNVYLAKHIPPKYISIHSYGY